MNNDRIQQCLSALEVLNDDELAAVLDELLSEGDSHESSADEIEEEEYEESEQCSRPKFLRSSNGGITLQTEEPLQSQQARGVTSATTVSTTATGPTWQESQGQSQCH